MILSTLVASIPDLNFLSNKNDVCTKQKQKQEKWNS